MDQPLDVIANFIGFVREKPMTDEEGALVAEALAELATAGEAA